MCLTCAILLIFVAVLSGTPYIIIYARAYNIRYNSNNINNKNYINYERVNNYNKSLFDTETTRGDESPFASVFVQSSEVEKG